MMRYVMRQVLPALALVGAIVSIASAELVTKPSRSDFLWGANLADLATTNADFVIKNDDLVNGLPGSAIKRNDELGAESTSFAANEAMFDNGDGCGLLVTRNKFLDGFHAAAGDKNAAELKLVDGLAGANVDVVLEDFAWPAAVFQLDIDGIAPAGPKDLGEIRVFVENLNNGDPDGRVWQDYDVFVSGDTTSPTADRSFTLLAKEVMTNIAVCAAPGVQADGYQPNVNNGSQTGGVQIGATLTRVFAADLSSVVATGVTSVRFVFYPVDNAWQVFWDRWYGPLGCTVPPDPANHFDPEDHDGYKRPFVGSTVKEIDILAARTQPVEICDSGIDDDGDTLVDAADPDCFGGKEACPPENCTDGLDNTGEGLIDCDDMDCRNAIVCNQEICNNSDDDDGDTLADCEDPDCVAFFPDCVCSKPRFDADEDTDVDQVDFAAFQACFTGPDPAEGTLAGMPIECSCFDVTGSLGAPDEAVDQNDLGLFHQCASGPGIPVGSTACDGVTP